MVTQMGPGVKNLCGKGAARRKGFLDSWPPSWYIGATFHDTLNL